MGTRMWRTAISNMINIVEHCQRTQGGMLMKPVHRFVKQ